ncbi:CDP-diacylglycerol--serine O-phosphatidyltransferase [Marinactinospora thermotolerans]|uniref:CDP-diacylglycerol--serine O-phosphatidyltransferase n=1 Tax=Marinactinospora thermotolerans DSM 45154 TaxID=1122192 RepID=A0A1T4S7F4_9ACTN|nr:CDP-diacylglycerol--serine O-phosphatidyltransferase [Marinactinospora thermotolerans]SKA24087.1 CDP-diacylglycerol---serine O-phosphatidyltransferase [Marinactinospora thermotolerans DSM 45154]
MTATDERLAAAVTGHEPAPRLRLVLADYFTLGNALCGFMAVWQLASAQVDQFSAGVHGPLQRGDVAAAVVLLLIAAVCDLFDGRVARKLGGSGMGAELDNLADVISFGFAPAFFVIAWGTLASDEGGLLPIAAAAAVLLAVVVRLARFSCQAPGDHYFTGLPSPFGAMAVITVVLLDPPVYLGVAAIFLVAWLMVSRVEYPKPRGRTAFAVLAWILGSVGCLTAWAVNAPAGDALLYSGSSLVLVLILAIPFYVLVTRRRAGRPGEHPVPSARKG